MTWGEWEIYTSMCQHLANRIVTNKWNYTSTYYVLSLCGHVL